MTHWMLDLIWVGNTLYPRWLVYLVLFVVIAGISAFSTWALSR